MGRSELEGRLEVYYNETWEQSVMTVSPTLKQRLLVMTSALGMLQLTETEIIE